MIGTALLVGLAYALLPLAGWAVLEAIGATAERDPLETAGLALPLGAGVLSLTAFLLAVIGFDRPLSSTTAVVLVATGAVGIHRFALARGRDRVTAPEDARDVGPVGGPAVSHSLADEGASQAAAVTSVPIAIPARWLAAAVFLVVAAIIVTAARAGFSWDGLFIWGLKARVLALAGRVPADYLGDASRAWSHADYPLGLPLTEAWIYDIAGAPDERFARPLFAAYLLSLLLLLYSAARRLSGPNRALLAVAALSFTPLLLPMTAWGYADLPLAVMILGAAGALVRWLDGGARSHLLLVGVLAAAAVWTKAEGAVFWAITCASVILAPRRGRGLAARSADMVVYALPALALVPWFAFRHAHALAGVDFAWVGVAGLASHLARLPSLLGLLALELIRIRHWGLLWPLVLILALTGRRRPWTTSQLWLAGLPAIYVLVLTCSYVFSVWVPWQEHVGASIGRIVFQVAPIALLAGLTRGDRALAGSV